jgi:hypothetical protein
MSQEKGLELNPSTQGWKQFLTAKKEMLDAYDKAKQQDEAHEIRTYRGIVAEAEFRKWLSSFLPTRYGITAGYIISQGQRDNVKAPHFDVIIYDQLESPVLWVETHPDLSNAGSSRAIPAEYVGGVIEVKSSFSSSSTEQAMEHLADLKPLMAGVDNSNERYKMYLPPAFFCSVVFFELSKKQEFSGVALRKLTPSERFRGFYGGVILRGEGLPPEQSGRINPLHSKTPLTETDDDRDSLLKLGMSSVKIGDDSYFGTLLMWNETHFGQFAFDLIALLNGTYDVGRLSSFHGFGFESESE